jgi:hypothetical protein
MALIVLEIPGRIAQRESVPFTRERSKVRSLVRPPEKAADLLDFSSFLQKLIGSSIRNEARQLDLTNAGALF